MKLLRLLVSLLPAASFCLAPTAALATDSFYDYERIVVSTPRVEKILGAPPGWGNRPVYSLAKSEAIYCYIEEDPERMTELLSDAADKGWDFRTEIVVDLEPSDCFDGLMEVASRPKEEVDPYSLFSTDFEYTEIQSLLTRYVASCIWEQNPDYFAAELAGVENPSGVAPYLASKYDVETYADAGTACFSGFRTLEARAGGFHYNFIQQLLLRQELDE